MCPKPLFYSDRCRHPHYLINNKFEMAVDDIFASAYYNHDFHELEVLPEREDAIELNSCARRHHSLRHFPVNFDVNAMDYHNYGQYSP